jgi:isochorismate synthase
MTTVTSSVTPFVTSTVASTSYLDLPLSAQLLEAYNEQTSFFFATPTQTFLGQGVREILSVMDGAVLRHGLPHQAKALLQRQSQIPLAQVPLVGVIPFDESAPFHLFMPEKIYRSGPLEPPIQADTRAKPTRLPQAHCTLQMIPEPSSYMQGVEQALAQIRDSELLKVVLSRSLELSFSEAIDLGWLLANLARHNRYGYTYLLDLAQSQRFSSKLQTSHKLIGASPELLVRRRGMQVEANPLAGSTPRSGDLAIDRQRAEALINSDKDRREHAVVVEAIADILNPFCRELDLPPIPSILQTDSMMHLSTCVRGTLRDPDDCALSLALALHPTPAVCGFPTQCAYSAIHTIEPFTRRYFTGIVGWVDDRGDGEWAVTIRCGEAEGSCLRLYAGAGVVAGSTAEKELAETSAKFRTMLNALGLDHLLEVTAE